MRIFDPSNHKLLTAFSRLWVLIRKKEANFGHYIVCINKLGHRKLIYVILSNESEEYSRLSIGSEERNARGVSLGLFPCNNFINLN